MHRWTHRRYRRQVSAYVDGELDAIAWAAMDQHVRKCWGCSEAVEQIRLIKHSLARRRDRRPAPLAAARLRRWAGSLQD